MTNLQINFIFRVSLSDLINNILISISLMLILQSSVRMCTARGQAGKICLGPVARHRSEAATLTVYTRSGTIEARHVEKRCSSCGTGYWHGYYTQVTIFFERILSW